MRERERATGSQPQPMEEGGGVSLPMHPSTLHPLPCVTAERPCPPGRKPHAPASPIFNAYHTQQTSSPQTAHCTPFTIAMRGHTPEVGGGDEVRHDPLGDEALHMFAAIFVAPAAQLSEELHRSNQVILRRGAAGLALHCTYRLRPGMH